MYIDLDLLWISKCTYHPKYLIKKHHHDYYQVVFILNGEGKITIGDSVYPAGVNQVYLFKPDIEHAIEASRSKSLNIIELKFYCRNVITRNMLYQLPSRMDGAGKSVRSSFIRIVEEVTIQDEYTEYIIKALITQIFCSLIRISNQEATRMPDTADVDARCGGNEKRLSPLAKVVDYIKFNYSEEIKLKDLADTAYLSPIYFCTVFKERYGVTPMQYLQIIRCEVAKTMLIETNESVTAISEKVGFQSIHYFSRFFKSHEGISPNEFRRRNQDFIIKDYQGNITDFS